MMLQRVMAWAGAAAVLTAAAAPYDTTQAVAGAAAVVTTVAVSPRATGAASHTTLAVAMRQFRFEPEEITAAVGDTIHWINQDPVPHTATAADSLWDSGRIERDGQWTMVVREEGVFEYLCTYHPTMKGVIRVIREKGRSRTP
ncbi:MAG: cupredoxin domain-containing protein [Longimicrobiales bacterium]